MVVRPYDLHAQSWSPSTACAADCLLRPGFAAFAARRAAAQHRFGWSRHISILKFDRRRLIDNDWRVTSPRRCSARVTSALPPSCGSPRARQVCAPPARRQRDFPARAAEVVFDARARLPAIAPGRRLRTGCSCWSLFPDGKSIGRRDGTSRPSSIRDKYSPSSRADGTAYRPGSKGRSTSPAAGGPHSVLRRPARSRQRPGLRRRRHAARRTRPLPRRRVYADCKRSATRFGYQECAACASLSASPRPASGGRAGHATAVHSTAPRAVR